MNNKQAIELAAYAGVMPFIAALIIGFIKHYIFGEIVSDKWVHAIWLDVFAAQFFLGLFCFGIYCLIIMRERLDEKRKNQIEGGK